LWIRALYTPVYSLGFKQNYSSMIFAILPA
jgi:hypothetical protein